ncbi:arginine permease [Saccharomycopsis crataegensis]|uniref:Arginine permease n=1 Tax=Saccharomycopsis crataegensis TaxID=43959 RepID=A0AAV5QJD8_9ASCO|nr:arginine permease [Saccharomycopsis crataegensis]
MSSSKDISSANSESPYSNKEYIDKDQFKNDAEDFEVGSVEQEVKRDLNPRVVSMMALGGTIGTGLFIGIATPISVAGPVNSLIAYIFVGTIVYGVTQSLGEMATYIPCPASFTVYNQRMLSSSLGFSAGYIYWFSWVTTLAVELSVVGQVIEYWTFAVPLWAWILIFWVILTAINLFPVKYYGEVEFWVACVKVVAIVGFLIYALCMVCGAGKTGPVGFRYWRNPGPWGPGKTPTKRFLGWVDSLINAIFTYQGTELVGITAGEAKNPKKAVPKAIRSVFYRILIFYIGSLFFLGLLVPYNDPKLSSTTSYIASSPFVIAISNSGTKALPGIFNAVILTTIISAGNSNIYTASRILYGLAQNGSSLKFFTKVTKGGVPYNAVIFSSLFGSLAFLSCSTAGAEAFNWLIQITAVAGLFAWLGISLCHIRFMNALKLKNISRDDLPFKAVGMPWMAIYAAFWVFILIFIQGYSVFLDFDVKTFFINYISVIIFVVVWLGHQFIVRDKWWIPLEEVDITTGVRDAYEDAMWEKEEEEAKQDASALSRFIDKVL